MLIDYQQCSTADRARFRHEVFHTRSGRPAESITPATDDAGNRDGVRLRSGKAVIRGSALADPASTGNSRPAMVNRRRFRRHQCRIYPDGCHPADAINPVMDVTMKWSPEFITGGSPDWFLLKPE